MDGNGMDAEAGRIDVSCGIGFPEDAETLGLIGRADVVYVVLRALLAACPAKPLARSSARKPVRWRTPSCAGPGGISW